MKPDEAYKILQTKLAGLIESNERTGERTRIENQLEKKFMAAWQFGPDRLSLGCKLNDAIRAFTTGKGDCVRGFDHCTYYTGENDQRIIVTQPYNTLASDILNYLTLHDGICPEIIDATEWAFYFPGRAKLFIVKFPFAFRKDMEDFTKKLRRDEIEKALKREDCESPYFEVAELP